MARDRKLSPDEREEVWNELQEEESFDPEPNRTVINLDSNPDPSTQQPARRMGGHSGGDFDGGGKGPAIGKTHAANDQTADHYGSREETQAALEGKIASQNTRTLNRFP